MLMYEMMAGQPPFEVRIHRIVSELVFLYCGILEIEEFSFFFEKFKFSRNFFF